VIRYAARAVPWGLVALACALVPALMAITAAQPETMWPLQGMAVGLLVAAAAWSMDERAAAVVDTLPRSLAWRTGARAAAALPLAGVWIAAVVVADDRLPDHRALFVQQGLAGLLLGVAVATWRRDRGEAVPGQAIAPAALGLIATLALVRPFPDRLPLFPLWDGEAWRLSAALWWGLAVVAAILLAWSLAGPRRRPARHTARRAT
jgi:hypothetical protein